MSIFPSFQHTLRQPCTCQGIGLHSGQSSELSLEPAPPGHGIVFERSDLDHKPKIPARSSHVINTVMCTQLGESSGASVATIEHLMAALAAWEVDNALIRVQGSEVPFMDGSSLPFMQMIETAGVVPQPAQRSFLRVKKPLRLTGKEGRFVELCPAETFSADVSFDFGGRQGMGAYTFRFEGGYEAFRKEIASARSFGFYEDAQKLYSQGLALGACLENTVVIDKGNVMNPEGLRFENEYVRHKILDAIGDLYLAGAPLQAVYRAHNAGHEWHHTLLQALFSDASAWEYEP